MGRILHPVGNLPAPFASIDQRLIDLEAGGHVLVRANQYFKAVVILSGRFDVRNCRRAFPVEPGDVLLAPCREDYRYYPKRSEDAAQLHVIRILWDPDMLRAGPGKPVAAGRGAAGECARRLATLVPALTVLPLLRGRTGRQWTDQVIDECRQEQPGRDRMLLALLEGLTIRLERHLAPASRPSASNADEMRSGYLAARARELLQERLAEKWTLDALAWELRLSGEHLARVFRRETGATIFAELARLRVERARELLLTTELRVDEIGTRVGLPDPTVFGRTFRRLEGVSPSAFRARTQGEMVFVPRQREG